MSTNIITRKTQTLIGVWIGGLNPKKPRGQTGVLTYKGDIKSLIEKTSNVAFPQKNDV